jgi:uncharacterized protein RhaS with RHS repeats
LLHTGAGGTTVDKMQYVLDPSGNRTQSSDADGTTSFAYDALDRLTQASYFVIPNSPAAASASYTYDAAGNRLSDGTNSYAYDGADRVTNPGFTYDASGNLPSDDTTTYTYDGANRLASTVKNGYFDMATANRCAAIRCTSRASARCAAWCERRCL